jgi:branched-chain amino acid aminotransferase
MRLVWVNGKEAGTISVYDRGFLYGDSVFETIRTYGGVPFALGDHIERLARSAERVFIPLPVSKAALVDEVERAIVAAANPESYARVMLTRGTGPLGLDTDLARDPSRVVFVEPLVTPPLAAYRDGIAVLLVRTARTTDATAASGAKVANYLQSLLALRDAKREGCSEALVVDGRGHVVEGATSNVFIVTAGSLVTPPEHEGILPGITRERILGVARDAGIACELRPIAEKELLSADEVFISSSIREILPVVRIDGHSVGSGGAGPLARKIHALFRAAVGAPGPMPWD